MKNLNYVIAILFLSLITSCSNTTTHEHDETELNDEKEIVAEDQSTKSEETNELQLSLNSGAKWDSDESTFTGMKRLELTLYNFGESSTNPVIDDYHKLGIALANINADIIKQCSMQGPDHDMLHVLLVPMLANVDVIKNGNDVVAAKVNVDALSQAIAQFFTHFEVK